MIIGFPKGVVINRSLNAIKILTNTDYVNKKKLNYSGNGYECYLMKHRDMPKLVSHGIFNMAITSSEWCKESKLESNFKIVRKLDWCDTRISLIGSVSFDVSKLALINFKNSSIVTEFASYAEEYLIDKGGDLNRIIKVSGSSESLVPNVYPFAIDCVETGDTITSNSLKELEVIDQSSVVVIAGNNVNIEDVNYIIDLMEGKK